MTGPAYIVEFWYMRLAEQAQTTGLTWRELQQLEFIQDLMRLRRDLWLAQMATPAEAMQVAS